MATLNAGIGGLLGVLSRYGLTRLALHGGGRFSGFAIGRAYS